MPDEHQQQQGQGESQDQEQTQQQQIERPVAPPDRLIKEDTQPKETKKN